MTIKLVTVIECDECGVLLEHSDTPIHQVNANSTHQGWSCFGLQYHLCPDCSSPYEQLEQELSPLESVHFLDKPYAIAQFKYWAIRPFIYLPTPDRKLEKRVVQVNKLIAASADKYRRWQIQQVTADELSHWWQEWRDSPYEDWRAFFKRPVPQMEPMLPPLHPHLEGAMGSLLSGLDASPVNRPLLNTAQLWHDLIQQAVVDARPEIDNPRPLKFPTPQMMMRHLMLAVEETPELGERTACIETRSLRFPMAHYAQPM